MSQTAEGMAGPSARRQGPLLRIAVPAWRGCGALQQPIPDPGIVSREEILELFGGELSGRRRRTRLTDVEHREKELARAIRSALYPVSEPAAPPGPAGRKSA
jgi:hypothetical protein